MSIHLAVQVSGDDEAWMNRSRNGQSLGVRKNNSAQPAIDKLANQLCSLSELIVKFGAK